MSENQTVVLAQQISDVLYSKNGICSDIESLAWVLQRFPIYDKQERLLEQSEVGEILKIISAVPTGKQRLYRHALDDILWYLKEECLWVIPEETEKKLIERDNEWLNKIAVEAGTAGRIFTRYESHKEQLYHQHQPLTPAEVALVIACEVAPLSLQHIAHILSSPDAIELSQKEPRLRVYHVFSQRKDEVRRHTHYFLPLFAYRVLCDYFASAPKPVNDEELLCSLNQWAEEHSLPIGKSFTWQYRFQILWFTHYKIPAYLLKDLSYPERHVSVFTTEQAKSTANIYDIDWDVNWYEHLNITNKKIKWIHKSLIKSYTKAPHPIVEPPWDPENILPKMLFLYTAERLIYGGVKKKDLALGTIINYTSLTESLAPLPLSYADAINEESLQRWASDYYHSRVGESGQRIAYYFLQFMSVQELTEALDLSQFTAPTSAPSVNAFRLEISQFDQLLNALIDTPSLNPLRNLFSVLAALLGTFCMLRRAEVLRLRKRDLSFDHNNGLLSLHVTHTDEGKTKSRVSRNVFTTIPVCYRYFFMAVLDIKKSTNPNGPLIGFENESIFSRQLYYLLPVSRALKAMFGRRATFHHLRHTGAHLLMFQALRGVSETPEGYRVETHPLEKQLMSNDAIKCRFNYWLEGRPFSHINHGILIDEVCKQIGHNHYATTRYSYLHDIDWLLPIVSPAHSGYTVKEYTHQELRYLLGLSATSNELSRVLVKLSPEYAEKSTKDKRYDKISLTEEQLKNALFKPKAETALAFKNDHFHSWQRSIINCPKSFINYLFHQMLVAKAVDFEAISQVWSLGAQHTSEPMKKASLTALKTLPPIELSPDGSSLVLKLACNTKNAQAFTKVFRQKEWQWLTCRFELDTNRKLRSDRQETILKMQFCYAKEDVMVRKHPLGQTQLTILLQPKSTRCQSVMQYAHQFLQQLQAYEDTL